MTAPRVRLSLLEWQSLDPSPGSDLEGVSLSDSATRHVAAQLTQAGILEVQELRTGLHVQASSFVGRLQLGDIEVTVQPKIVQMQLVRLLRYGYGLRELRLYRPAGYAVVVDSIPDLLARQLAAEVEELLSRGFRRAYIRTEEELGSPRGRINVQGIARQGGVIRAALPCIHHPRTEDSLLNRVLLAGLRLGARITRDAALALTLNRLAATIAEGVSIARLDGVVIQQAWQSVNRLTAAYTPALTLIEMLARGRGITLDEHEARVSVPGFLFDMNRLFQAVLSRFLRENLAGLIVRDEYRLKGMLAYHPHGNPWHRTAPTPRPDYAVLDGSRVITLLDAKYMDLWERRAIGRDILYQLAIYALSQPPEATAVILYPTGDVDARDAQVEISDPVYGRSRAHVVARPVQLGRLEPLLTENIGPSAARDRAEYARWLVFGSSVPG